MYPFQKPLSARAAFTLVELLVVIAVLGILAATLIPVISVGRDKAEVSQSISRLKNIHVAIQLYGNDNGGRFPTSGVGDDVDSPAGKRWSVKIADYIPEFEGWRDRGGVSYIYGTEILRCPTVPPGDGAKGIYGYNRNFATELTEEGARKLTRSSLSNPSRLPLFASPGASSGLLMGTTGPHPSARDYGYSGPTANNGPSPNHGRNCIFLFADGHVESRDVTDENAWPWNDPDIFLP